MQQLDENNTLHLGFDTGDTYSRHAATEPSACPYTQGPDVPPLSFPPPPW